MVDSYFSTKITAMWPVYVTFDWGTCDTLLKIMFGMSIPGGMSWFDANAVLIPVVMPRLAQAVTVTYMHDIHRRHKIAEIFFFKTARE